MPAPVAVESVGELAAARPKWRIGIIALAVVVALVAAGALLILDAVAALAAFVGQWRP